MRKSRFSEEQIAYALRQVEQGTPATELCRKLGISEQTFYTWKKRLRSVQELGAGHVQEDRHNFWIRIRGLGQTCGLRAGTTSRRGERRRADGGRTRPKARRVRPPSYSHTHAARRL